MTDFDFLDLIRQIKGSVYSYANEVAEATGRNIVSARNGVYNLRKVTRLQPKNLELHSRLLGVSPKVIEDSFKIKQAQKLLGGTHTHIDACVNIHWGEPYDD